MIVIPASLAIIFLLLFLTFGRVRQAALVILNVPFALVGGIAALWIRGLNLNLSPRSASSPSSAWRSSTGSS